MKHVKRIAAALIAAMLVFVMVGCGGKDMSNSKYVGTWKATTAEYAGIELSVEDIFGEFEFTLDEKGKVSVTLAGETQTGKWDETEDGVSIDGQGTFTGDENTLTVEQDGVTITFEKQ